MNRTKLIFSSVSLATIITSLISGCTVYKSSDRDKFDQNAVGNATKGFVKSDLFDQSRRETFKTACLSLGAIHRDEGISSSPPVCSFYGEGGKNVLCRPFNHVTELSPLQSEGQAIATRFIDTSFSLACAASFNSSQDAQTEVEAVAEMLHAGILEKASKESLR
jgi:hypothetical protein